MCFVTDVKTWLASLWLLHPRLGFVPVVAEPGTMSQPRALRLINPEETGPQTDPEAPLLHRWGAALPEVRSADRGVEFLVGWLVRRRWDRGGC